MAYIESLAYLCFGFVSPASSGWQKRKETLQMYDWVADDFLLKGVKSCQGSVSRVKPVLSESDVITLPSSPGSSALST